MTEQKKSTYVRRTLSAREREVLAYVVEGRRDKEICKALGIELATVKVHLKSAYKILGVHNRTQAAVKIVREGILDDERNQSSEQQNAAPTHNVGGVH